MNYTPKFSWCIKASTDRFKAALDRANRAERKVAELEEAQLNLKLRVSELEKDLHVSQLRGNDQLLKAKSAQVALSRPRKI